MSKNKIGSSSDSDEIEEPDPTLVLSKSARQMTVMNMKNSIDLSKSLAIGEDKKFDVPFAKSVYVGKEIHVKITFGGISKLGTPEYIPPMYKFERIFIEEGATNKLSDEAKISILFFGFLERLISGRGEGFYYNEFCKVMNRRKDCILFRKLDSVIKIAPGEWWTKFNNLLPENTEEADLQSILQENGDLFKGMCNFSNRVVHDESMIRGTDLFKYFSAIFMTSIQIYSGSNLNSWNPVKLYDKESIDTGNIFNSPLILLCNKSTGSLCYKPNELNNINTSFNTIDKKEEVKMPVVNLNLKKIIKIVSTSFGIINKMTTGFLDILDGNILNKFKEGIESWPKLLEQLNLLGETAKNDHEWKEVLDEVLIQSRITPNPLDYDKLFSRVLHTILNWKLFQNSLKCKECKQADPNGEWRILSCGHVIDKNCYINIYGKDSTKKCLSCNEIDEIFTVLKLKSLITKAISEQKDGFNCTLCSKKTDDKCQTCDAHFCKDCMAIRLNQSNSDTEFVCSCKRPITLQRLHNSKEMNIIIKAYMNTFDGNFTICAKCGSTEFTCMLIGCNHSICKNCIKASLEQAKEKHEKSISCMCGEPIGMDYICDIFEDLMEICIELNTT